MISMGQLRNKLAAGKEFRLTYDEPLSPLTIYTTFASVSVILSSSPYIALRNEYGSVCLSHVKKISASNKGNVRHYKIVCDDYTGFDKPATQTFRLYVD